MRQPSTDGTPARTCETPVGEPERGVPGERSEVETGDQPALVQQHAHKQAEWDVLIDKMSNLCESRCENERNLGRITKVKDLQETVTSADMLRLAWLRVVLFGSLQMYRGW